MGSLPKMPKFKLPKMPKISLPKMPKISLPKIPKNPFGGLAAKAKAAAAAIAKKAGAAARKVGAAAKKIGAAAKKAIKGPKAPTPVGGPGSLPPGAKPASKPITPMPLNPAQAANDIKGKAFCAANCMINHAKVAKKCLVGTKLVKCKRCMGKPTNKDPNMGKVCATVCNANLPASPCEFYGYSNNVKKVFDAALLKKYGLAILRKRK